MGVVRKKVFLYVSGGDFSAMCFEQEYNIQEFYEEMIKKGITKTTIETDLVYANVEIKEFNDIDDSFIAFIRNNFIDYDMSKDRDFFEVKMKADDFI